jgi:hypothetical protein
VILKATNFIIKITARRLPQVIATLCMICILFGFQNLYATLVCVACSQLEKLRAAILAIRQTHVTSEQDCGDETDQQDEEEQAHSSEELFHHMQRRLNHCIRHHQEIIRYVYIIMIKS